MAQRVPVRYSGMLPDLFKEGKGVVAQGKLEPGGLFRADTVLAHLQPRIARFKLPRRVVFMDTLPKSALGKVQKPALQAELLRTNP